MDHFFGLKIRPPGLKLALTWAVLCLYALSISSQNLVPNGDFEVYSECPTDISQLNRVAPWFDPSLATADYFNICDTSGIVSVPANFIGEQMPQSGDAYAGIYVAQTGGAVYREYLEIALSETLTENYPYKLTWYVNLSDFSSCAPSNVCVSLLNDQMVDFTTAGFITQPTLVEHTFCNPTGSIIDDKNEWFELESYFYASGNEKYLMIGNNLTDAFAGCSGFGGVYNAAYLYVDNVAITPLEVQSVSYDTAICKGQIVNIDINKLIDEPDNVTPEFLWQDGYIGGNRNITNAGLYTILIQNGFVTDTVYIQLNYLPDCPEVFIIPNAFSPNNDGINDKFRIIEENIKIETFDIYNRWGDKIFEVSNYNEGWDGTIAGVMADTGVYLYYLKYYTYETEKHYTKTGYITLIK